MLAASGMVHLSRPFRVRFRPEWATFAVAKVIKRRTRTARGKAKESNFCKDALAGQRGKADYHLL
jgi:hypothetical protein